MNLTVAHVLALLAMLLTALSLNVSRLGGLGLVFLLARVLHPLAMFQRWLRLRQLAHISSLLAQLTAAWMLLR